MSAWDTERGIMYPSEIGEKCANENLKSNCHRTRKHEAVYVSEKVPLRYARVLIEDCQASKPQHGKSTSVTVTDAIQTQVADSEQTKRHVKPTVGNSIEAIESIVNDDKLSAKSEASSHTTALSTKSSVVPLRAVNRSILPTISFLKLSESEGSQQSSPTTASLSPKRKRVSKSEARKRLQLVETNCKMESPAKTHKQQQASDDQQMHSACIPQVFHVKYNGKTRSVGMPNLQIVDCRWLFNAQSRALTESLAVPDPERSRPIYGDDVLKVGMVVLAYLPVYPLWPGIIMREPICDEHYIPTTTGGDYHVVFCFDSRVTRAWIPASRIYPFCESMKVTDSSNFTKPFMETSAMKRRSCAPFVRGAEKAIRSQFAKFDPVEHAQAFRFAKLAMRMSPEERLAAFRIRYANTFKTPQSQNKVKRKQNSTKSNKSQTKSPSKTHDSDVTQLETDKYVYRDARFIPELPPRKRRRLRSLKKDDAVSDAAKRDSTNEPIPSPASTTPSSMLEPDSEFELDEDSFTKLIYHGSQVGEIINTSSEKYQTADADDAVRNGAAKEKAKQLGAPAAASNTSNTSFGDPLMQNALSAPLPVTSTSNFVSFSYDRAMAESLASDSVSTEDCDSLALLVEAVCRNDTTTLADGESVQLGKKETQQASTR